MKFYRNTHQGFTLLEILVALAVASIGLAGVIKVVGGNAFNAQHLQNRTLSQWVAMNRIAELRVKNEFPSIGKKTGDMEMAGRKWYWQQETKGAPLKIPGVDVSKELRLIEINVYADADRKTGVLSSLSTYLSKPQ